MSQNPVYITLATLLLAFSSLACDSECVKLGKRICGCERTESLQRACSQRISNDAGAREGLTKEDQNRCKTLSKGCSCAKLAQGDFAACGLALETDEAVVTTENP